MRLIKLKLGIENFIWTHNDIILNIENRESPLIDFDDLTDQDKKIILASEYRRDIIITNEENKQINNLNEKEITEYCTTINVEDIEDDEKELQDLLEVNCVTIGDEIEEEIIEEEEDKSEEEAIKILNKNGHTVKRIISKMDINDDYFYKIIKACYNIERNNKKRKIILKEINSKLGQLNA